MFGRNSLLSLLTPGTRPGSVGMRCLTFAVFGLVEYQIFFSQYRPSCCDAV